MSLVCTISVLVTGQLSGSWMQTSGSIPARGQTRWCRRQREEEHSNNLGILLIINFTRAYYAVTTPPFQDPDAHASSISLFNNQLLQSVRKYGHNHVKTERHIDRHPSMQDAPNDVPLTQEERERVNLFITLKENIPERQHPSHPLPLC